jgi:purine nucleosidase
LNLEDTVVRIILDTDLSMGEPGSEIDDGFALALALADPDIQVEMITTVNGNTDVDTATLLTLELAERLGIDDVPVFRGASAPLIRPDRARHASAEIVAKYGHRTPADGYAAVEMVRRVMANPGQITIVAIGPLTNLAAALTIEPRFARNVRAIVVMGGAFFRQGFHSGMPGEFNAWVDPEAAHAVLHSGAPVRWVGLDVTLRVRLTREHAARMIDSGQPFAAFAGQFTAHWIDRLAALYPGDPDNADSCAMHDPLAVAAVTRPELVTWRDAHVDIVIGDGIARGVMVTDLLHGTDGRKANCTIATDVDADAFMSYFLTSITSL